jgi:hypothetical protein
MSGHETFAEKWLAWRTPVRPHHVLAVGASVAVALTIFLGLGASRWVGETFPGFLVLPNRVVASIGRLGWPTSRSGSIYQSVVEAVDEVPVADSGSLYDRVSEKSSVTPFAYELRRGLHREQVVIPSARFTTADFVFLFGAYLATGLLYLIAGLLGATFLAERRIAIGVLCVGGIGGLYALSAVAIYDASGGLALHALAEALFPAALVHLAIALSHRDGPLASTLVLTAWWLSFALVIPYELLLEQPAGYSVFHAACETYIGIAGAAFVVSLLVERGARGDGRSQFEKTALAGALLGLGLPAVVMILSGLSGGSLPVNLVTATAFLFPLAIGWGVIREKLALPASPKIVPVDL